jgi:hypothetical protein
MQADKASIEKRHAVVSTVALLALRCVWARLSESGLSLADAEMSLIQRIARAAFDKLTEGAERIEELDFSKDRLDTIWAELLSEIRKHLDSNSTRITLTWIAEFHDFLSSDGASLVTALLRLRADPTYMAGRFHPRTRQVLVQKTAEVLVPLALRADVVPREQNDLQVYSYWDEAGNPANVLDQFCSSRVAETIVQQVSELESPDERQSLKNVLSSNSWLE